MKQFIFLMGEFVFRGRLFFFRGRPAPLVDSNKSSMAAAFAVAGKGSPGEGAHGLGVALHQIPI